MAVELPRDLGRTRLTRRAWRQIAAAVVATGGLARTADAGMASYVSLSTVDAHGYAVDDLNAVSCARNTIATVGGYQSLAYYAYNGSSGSASNATIKVARRASGTATWSTLNTGISIATGVDNVAVDSIISTNGIDDHDVVAVAVAGVPLLARRERRHGTAYSGRPEGPGCDVTYT